MKVQSTVLHLRIPTVLKLCLNSVHRGVFYGIQILEKCIFFKEGKGL